MQSNKITKVIGCKINYTSEHACMHMHINAYDDNPSAEFKINNAVADIYF